MVELANYKNKTFVLLDFWASWCMPCLKEIPKMKEVYKKYNEKGLTIIGISLDRVKDSWSEAIRKYNLNVWPQILSSETNEKDEKENNLSYLYNCDAIPFYVLIDKEGKVVAKWEHIIKRQYMKTTLWTIMLLCAINNISAQVKSQVKESFELTSIAFRLAGAEEYINNTIPGYTADIDNYFSKYREHKLISYIKKIREEQGIAYDAVPAATGCIEIKRGKVIIDPQCDASKISMIDSRWTEESFRTFVRLLNDFYRQTKFKDFYTLHRGLYDIAETRLNTILVDLNAEWFKSMFGEGPENTIVVASLCNGPGNYAFNGITKGEKRGIVIGCSTDKEGNPAYSRFLITVIVHELLHHYTNPCLAQYWSQIDSASQIIYPHVKEKMAKLAYGSTNSTMIEWFNNLLTIMYFKDNPNR